MMRRFLVSLAACFVIVAAFGAAADWHAPDDCCVLCQLRVHSPGLQPLLPLLVDASFDQWSVVAVVVVEFAGAAAEHSTSRAPPRNS
jgi:hypothetical protein